MVIKKYIVKNMNEALTRIRYELGKDAIIISQRKIREKGITGFLKPKLIEVTAALENNKIDRSNNIKNDREIESFKNSLSDLKDIISKEEEKKEFKYNKQINYAKENNLETEVNEIKELLNKVLKNTNKEKKENIISEYLKEIDIEENSIKKLNIEDYENTENFKEDFKNLLEKEVSISNNALSGRVVLVGPTGVGKTTTIAKLAGRMALIEKKKVGLITIDTYRIGAVEQLKTYAEIMNIPFKVVITLKEMTEAIETLKDCDVILIDTTGRSCKNTMQLSELRAFIDKVEADNISLVISAVTKNNDIETILKGYEDINYDNVIITKLDETNSYGNLYKIIEKSKKNISYITIGQNVPDDIKVPSSDELIKLILGEEFIC